MKNKIDLHMHTTCSDGTFTPEELVEHAKKAGLEIIAVTDHDTLSHVSRIRAAAKPHDLQVISGVEVSASCPETPIHILGYFVDTKSDALNTLLEAVQKDRHERNQNILKKLNDLGVHVTEDDLDAYAGEEQVGRPHFAQMLLKKGYVNSIPEAFDRFLADGKPAYVNLVRFSPKEIIAAIHAAGGIASLAHPRQLRISNAEKKTQFIQKLVEDGLDAIEVYHSSHSQSDISFFSGLVERFNLLYTGGSDFHGDHKSHVELGKLPANHTLPLEMVDRLQAKASQWALEKS